jgi:hypothetical protein
MMEHPCPLYIQKLSLLTEALSRLMRSLDSIIDQLVIGRGDLRQAELAVRSVEAYINLLDLQQELRTRRRRARERGEDGS